MTVLGVNIQVTRLSNILDSFKAALRSQSRRSLLRLAESLQVCLYSLFTMFY